MTETFTAEHTRQLLWSHAAWQIITTLPDVPITAVESVGCGWGLRYGLAGKQAFVLHPSSNARTIGDLALTLPGANTWVIPRCGASYVEYLHIVATIVAAVVEARTADRDPV